MSAWVLAVAVTQGTAQRSRQTCPSPKIFLEELGVQTAARLLISTHPSTDCNPPWSWGQLVGPVPTFSLQLTPMIKPSCQHISGGSWCISFVAPACGSAPGSPSSNIEQGLPSQVPRDYFKQRSSSLQVCRRASKKRHKPLSVPPCKGFDCILSHRPEGPAPNQPACGS